MQYESLKNPSKDQGLESEIDRANGILSWSEQWKKQSIAVEPKEIRVEWQWREKFSWSLQIQTNPKIPLTIMVDNPKVHILNADKSSTLKDFYFEKEVRIEIDRKDMGESIEATFTISSPQSPDFFVRVPLRIEVPK